MNILTLVGLITLVLMAPHLTKRDAVKVMFINFFIGVVLLVYEAFK